MNVDIRYFMNENLHLSLKTLQAYWLKLEWSHVVKGGSLSVRSQRG